MKESAIYEELDPHVKKYVDALVEHADTALWPERKSALLSFWRGIDKADPEDLTATLNAIGLSEVPEDCRAEMVFRAVLTAYLERLADRDISNPDQAMLFSCSLDPTHVAMGEQWLSAHPEYSNR